MTTTTNTRYSALAAFCLAIVFDQLFWHQTIGINLSLFALLSIGLSWSLIRQGGSMNARLAAVATAVCAAMLVIHGPFIAGLGLGLSLACFAGFMHEAELRTNVVALLQGAMNTLLAPLAYLRALRGLLGDRRVFSQGWRWGRMLFLPLIIVVVYVVLYRGGNSRFNTMTAGLLDDLGDLLNRLFGDLLTPHTFFFLFGLMICGGLLIHYYREIVIGVERGASDDLVRQRMRRPKWLAPLNMGALERERRVGVLLLVLVNVLLLVVNAIDIHWMWFGFTVPANFSLKEFVHEGTWLLIVSIVLSMGILLVLFRRNLNFHPKARLLRILAFAWLVQNFVLGISVFLRNYHYIGFHGLAYLRIGVVVFLALMLVGLVTLALKIHRRKSFFYLFRVNGWAAFTVLIVLTTIDWDSTIVRYNLRHWNSGEIDVDNYLAMSDKVLPLLYEDLPRVAQQMAKHRENVVRWVDHLDPDAFKVELDWKREAFLRRYAEQGWQSWTWADKRTYDGLKRLGLAELPSTVIDNAARTAIPEVEQTSTK